MSYCKNLNLLDGCNYNIWVWIQIYKYDKTLVTWHAYTCNHYKFVLVYLIHNSISCSMNFIHLIFLNDWLIVYTVFIVLIENIHSYEDSTIAGEGQQIERFLTGGGGVFFPTPFPGTQNRHIWPHGIVFFITKNQV